MAVKQYIGARYVPLMYGDWTANHVYEPLTIVTYLNQSYTSKKTVPASVGNPADNPSYWAATGVYNAQVEQLQQDVEDLSDKVDAIEAPPRHIAVICDSYGTYNGAGTGHEVSYNINDRLLSYLGWNNSYVHYSAQNGAGFCNGLYLSQLNSMSVSADVRPLVKDLYIIGGWNDESNREGVTQGAFQTAAAAFKTAALAKFPNARLHICFAAWCYQSTRTMQELRTTLGWHKALTKSGWIFDENMQYVLHNSSLLIGGNVHPNQDGVDALADALAQVVLNGECHVSYNLTCGAAYITLPGTLPASSAITLYQQLRDDIAIVEMYAQRGCITLTETASLALDGAHTIELFSYTGPTVVKGYTNRVGGCCSINILNDGTLYTVPGELVIADGSVKFFPDYYPAGSSYLTLSAITKISIPKVHFACKAW